MSTVVVLSGGGIKGTVAAARCAKEHELILLHIDHGQESSLAEIRALTTAASSWPGAQVLTCAMPKQDYAATIARASIGAISGKPDQGAGDAERIASVLTRKALTPLFLTLGARTALRYGAGSVVFGVSGHASGVPQMLPGAEAGPDALREAVHGFGIMLDALLRPRTRIRVETPLIDLTYGEIIKLGRRLSVPFARTWSCETRAATPCESCPSCMSRRNAFAEAGFVDPQMEPVAASGQRSQTS